MHWPVFDPDRTLDGAGGIHAALRDVIDGAAVQELTYGETIACDLMLVLDVACLAHLPRYLPQVTARQQGIVLRPGEKVPQAPVGVSGALWLPTGPDAREVLVADPQKNVWSGDWQETVISSDTPRAWYIAALQQLCGLP